VYSAAKFFLHSYLPTPRKYWRLKLYSVCGLVASGQPSGTTATLVIVDGWTVTVACVGDSRCILDAQGTVTALTIDHRLDSNEEE
jgi:hypothetical protein